MELTDFIVCDDIRREITGKTLLIGVYDDDIKILKSAKTDEFKGAHLSLSFLARIASSAQDKELLPTRFEMDIKSRPQGQVLAKIVGALNIKMPFKRISIAGRVAPLQIEYQSNGLSIELRLFNGENRIATLTPYPILIEFIDQLPST